MAIAAKLPWQLSVALALVTFLVLHAIAGQDPGVVTSTKDIGSFAAKGYIRALASIGQYVFPIIFMAGAVVGFFSKRRREELIQTVASSGSSAALSDMTWREFESLVEEAFRLRGYSVRRLGGEGPDGGVDLVLDRGAEKVLVQCKQWRAYRVGVPVVRELYGVMAARGAASGIVVTCGTFTPDALEFARGRNLQLIAGDELRDLVREAQHSAATAPKQSVPPHAPAATSGCPICGSPMVKRQAKRGANAGQFFFGCSKYPACRGTRAA